MCRKIAEDNVYLVQVVDNDTTDIYVENKTNCRIRLRVTVSKLNNQGFRDTFTSQITLNKKNNTTRNIGNAVDNTLCIVNVTVVFMTHCDKNLELEELEEIPTIFPSEIKNTTQEEEEEKDIVEVSTDLMVLESQELDEVEKPKKSIATKIKEKLSGKK